MKKLLLLFLWVTLMALRAVSLLIPRPLLVKLGGFLGGLAFHFLRKERLKTLDHLKKALGDEKTESELNRLGKECFQNLGKSFFEILNLDRIPSEKLDQLVEVRGGERLKDALAEGRGAIYITGHVGNWELMAAAIGRRFPLNVIGAPIYDPRVEGLMLQIRGSHGTKTIVRDSEGSTKKIFRILKEGGIVGLLIDQDTRTAGVHVPFFGHPAFTTTGAANIALRTGAPVFAGFISRGKDDRHIVQLYGPLPFKKSGDKDADIRDNTAAYTKLIEEKIRETPEQWVWMHRRWRTSPPPEQNA